MATTDAAGKYVIDNLAPGDYVIDVKPGAGYRDAPDKSVLALKDGETRDAGTFFLTKMAGRVTGVVVDETTGLPLAGVEVIAR